MLKTKLAKRSRLLRIIGGGMLAGYAMARDGRPMVNDGLFVLGVASVMEGLHGYCVFSDKLGLSTQTVVQGLVREGQ